MFGGRGDVDLSIFLVDGWVARGLLPPVRFRLGLGRLGSAIAGIALVLIVLVIELRLLLDVQIHVNLIVLLLLLSRHHVLSTQEQLLVIH